MTDLSHNGRATAFRGTGVDLCADFSGGKASPGSNNQMFGCNQSSAQLWLLRTEATPGGLPLGEFRSDVSEKFCMDIKNGTTKPGTNVRLWTCNDTPAQKWRMR